MTTEITPARNIWTPSRTESAVFLALMVVIVSDMPEPIPFWQSSWGQAPSVGTVLLIIGVILALVRFSPGYGTRTDASQ